MPWRTAVHTPTNTAAAAAFGVPEAAASAGSWAEEAMPACHKGCLDLVAASLAPPEPSPAAFKWAAWLAFRSRELRADVSPAAAAAPYFGKLNIWLLLPSFGALLPRLPSVPVMQSMAGLSYRDLCPLEAREKGK